MVLGGDGRPWPNFMHFPDRGRRQNILGVDISNNISTTFRSGDRIPEVKMATAMFEVANTPDCYHDEKEDIKTDFIVLVDRTTFT
jgi:hypothetical protein